MPHSDIGRSKRVCCSLPRFVALHVLRRHVAPRHSPAALHIFKTSRCTHSPSCHPDVSLQQSNNNASLHNTSLANYYPTRTTRYLTYLVARASMTAYFSHSTSSTIDGKEDSRALCPLKTLPAMSIRYSVVKVTPDLYTNLCWYPADYTRGTERYRYHSTQRMNLVEASGLEPLTSCLQSRRSPN